MEMNRINMNYSLEDIFWATALKIIEDAGGDPSKCFVSNNQAFMTGNMPVIEFDKCFRVSIPEETEDQFNFLANLEVLIWGGVSYTRIIKEFIETERY